MPVVALSGAVAPVQIVTVPDGVMVGVNGTDTLNGTYALS